MRNVFIFLSILAILVIGWMLWTTTPDAEGVSEKTREATQAVEEKSAVSLVGKTVCRPVGSGEDCSSFGLLMENGDFYALQTENMENGLPENFNGEVDVRITGEVEQTQGKNQNLAGVIYASFIEPAEAYTPKNLAEDSSAEEESDTRVLGETTEAETE